MRSVLCLSLFFGLAACGGESTPPPAEKPAPAETAKAKQPAEAKQSAKANTVQDAAPAIPVPEALQDPAALSETAPDQFEVLFTTTQGEFTVQVDRAWSPNGADRFYNLVKAGFYTDVAFFRNIEGFMVQFGLHGNPAVNAIWKEASIKDDEVQESNTPGMITFATAGPDTRTTQLFINHGDNKNLDGMGFSPFGKVTEGMDVVGKLYSGYGEGAPRGRGPNQGAIQTKGNEYLKARYPKLDYLKSATLK